ncbi:MAG: carbon starvation protein A [Balneolaceae bacterium]|nr:MAG: carbon starvation protein A [Balneolaceae bacterium]
MNLIVLILISAVIFLFAYRFYGRFISDKLGLDDQNVTPAHTQKDGVDYIPSKTPMVLGHHFASIAGAGPIVGPVIAVAFGWIPAVLWIIIGGIFFGAVHDLTSLTASLRHQGKSIGELIERYIGRFGKKLFILFAFATLILVIAVFMDIVARTFVTIPSAASASVGFIFLALLFGAVYRSGFLPFWLLSLTGVVVMYGMVYAGQYLPFELGYWFWISILLVYIFFAAVSPVQLLLQPRDYLNSYLLYGMILSGFLGVIFSNPTPVMDNEIHFYVEGLGFLFPVLFVTIACGAISGFHSLVASGTTSKQIDKESDAKVVGFGGMLIESMLAILAVGAVMVLPREQYLSGLTELGPVTLFSQGLGGFISSLGLPETLAVSFVALTVSAFALTTLDTCTRLARFTFREYFEKESSRVQVVSGNRFVSTAIVAVLSTSLLLTGQFQELWPIFGSANQLLAALALLAVSVWLIKSDINPLFTLIPMVFMFAVTISSLIIFVWNNIKAESYVLAAIALALVVLAVVLIHFARKSLKGYALSGQKQAR